MSEGVIPPALHAARFVPVPAGEKATHEKGWPNIRLTLEEVEQHLARGGNIAIRLGPASGYLVDADLDCAEGMVLADLYLLPSGAEFGRKSKARSHRFYVS